MKNFLGTIAAAATMMSFAQAASITIANADFEDLSHVVTTVVNGAGAFGTGAAGYGVINGGGGVGTLAPNDGIYSNVPSGSRVAVVNSNTTLYQDLGISIQANTSYELSALFGNRLDFASFGGYIGFYAGGDPTNVIGQMALTTPTVQGLLELQSFFLASAAFSNYAGQSLGIFIKGATSGAFAQLTVDNLALYAGTTPVPIPGAIWLFGTAIAGAGGLMRRRKKATA